MLLFLPLQGKSCVFFLLYEPKYSLAILAGQHSCWVIPRQNNINILKFFSLFFVKAHTILSYLVQSEQTEFIDKIIGHQNCFMKVNLK